MSRALVAKVTKNQKRKLGLDKHKSQNMIFSDEFVGGPNQCEKDDPFCYVSKLKFYSEHEHISYLLIYFLRKLFF